MTRILAAILFLGVVAGCAATAPQGNVPSPMPDARSAEPRREPARPEAAASPAPAPASPLPGTRVGTTASGGAITATSPGRPAVADTLPNADAKAVLESIPEPLPPSERVPARAPAATETQGSASDSAPAPADTAALDGDVPVPEPTRPLGDRPPPPPSADATAAAPPATSPAPPPATPSTPAKPDTCWRLQLAAVPESERAERLKSGAESQLDVPCVVEKEKSLYKVRTRGCMDSATIERLRARAKTVGFAGAFRFRDRAP
jgi:hypothetical protein